MCQFHEAHSALPLPGAVPDMKARSADYIRLQSIYRSKARADAAEVLGGVRALEERLARAPPRVAESEVEAFCKSAGHVKLVRGRPFHVARRGERLAWGDRARAVAAALADPDSLALLYVAFLARDRCASARAADAAELAGVAHALIDDLLGEAGEALAEPAYGEVRAAAGRICAEMARAGGAELHNVAALTGGMVAQEVIKVVTKQYIPVDNTCLFDGVLSKSAVLRV